MKTLIVIMSLLFSNLLSSQYITGLNLTQNGESQIKANLKAYLPSAGDYFSHTVQTNDNIITLSVCYWMIGATAVVYPENNFFIDLPTNGNYTLIVKMYSTYDVTMCDYQQLEDTATLNFSTPIQGTVSLATDEHDTAEPDIKLIPIPAKDELTILTKNKIENVSIYDASGKKLPVIFQNNKINTSKLQNGTYFLEIVNDKKRIHRKFTVQK